MKYAHLTPTFSEIFGMPLPERFNDWKRLPSIQALHLISRILLLMKGRVALGQKEEEVILNLLRIPPGLSERIRSYLKSKRDLGKDISLFSRNTCLQFAKRILIEGADSESEPPDIPTFEFIGYYLAVEESIGKEDNEAISELRKIDVLDSEYFQKYTWPMSLKSYWLNQRKNIIFEVIKLSHSIKYLSEHKSRKVNYPKALDTYVSAMGFTNIWTFLQRILEVVNHINNLPEGSLPIIPHTPALRDLLDAWARPQDEIGHVNPTKGFEALYTKPLLKINEGYLIIDVKILSVGLHDFVLHHFANHHAVKDSEPGLSALMVKQHLSNGVIEQILFRRILEYIFPERQNRLWFPTSNDTPDPDAFACRGADHFYFEMKDYTMPHEVVDKREYTLIRDDIQKKFIEDLTKTKPRGAAVQLSRYIRSASLVDKIKPDRTYPIVIYSDDMYGMPGISSIVSSEFERLHVSVNGGSRTRPLVMMSLTSLFLCAHAFRTRGMAHFMREYYRRKKGKAKSKVDNEYIRDIEINLSIEATTLSHLRPSFSEDKKFLRHMFTAFLTNDNPDSERL